MRNVSTEFKKIIKENEKKSSYKTIGHNIAGPIVEFIRSKYQRKIAVILLAKAPDVGRMDNTFHYINLYPVDSAVRFINSYPLITMYPLDSAMRHLKNWAQNYKLRIRDFTIAFYSTTLSISFFVTETR